MHYWYYLLCQLLSSFCFNLINDPFDCLYLDLFEEYSREGKRAKFKQEKDAIQVNFSPLLKNNMMIILIISSWEFNG